MARELKYLVIHCTATPAGREVTGEEIKDWHMSEPPEGRGWSKVGYSDLIHLDGTITNLTPFNQDGRVEYWELTYGSSGINSVSRHIVYAGGISEEGYNAKDTRTSEQKKTLDAYVNYMVRRHPDILIAGHNQFKDKACPSFCTVNYCKELGIPEKNIFKGEHGEI